jgi:hypothetical protein
MNVGSVIADSVDLPELFLVMFCQCKYHCISHNFLFLQVGGRRLYVGLKHHTCTFVTLSRLYASLFWYIISYSYTQFMFSKC